MKGTEETLKILEKEHPSLRVLRQGIDIVVYANNDSYYIPIIEYKDVYTGEYRKADDPCECCGQDIMEEIIRKPNKEEKLRQKKVYMEKLNRAIDKIEKKGVDPSGN